MKRLVLVAMLAGGCVDFAAKYDACVQSGRCSDEVDSGQLDAGQPDAGEPDGGESIVFPPAAVWISSGGGASGATNSALGLCVGGVSSPGVSTAPSGATITWGFFSSSSNE